MLRCNGFRLLVAGAALWLAGCASMAPSQPTQQAPFTTGALEPIKRWQGRFAITTLSQPPHAERAAFELTGTVKTGQLDIISPIGTTVARMIWRPGQASLISGGTYTDYADLDALSQALVSTHLPVEALFNWLQGQPSPINEAQLRSSVWVVDTCQVHVGRLKAQRDYPLPRVSLTVVFEPVAPTEPGDSCNAQQQP
jgi:outer membrane lipoprotein LolB